MKIKLTNRVTKNGEADAADVHALKAALNRLGYYTPDPAIGMTGEAEQALWDSLYAFQRRHTLYYNDTKIGPGSTTERIINRELDALGDDGFYIWRTVGDGKVRGEHATRAGKRFDWSDEPAGGHPGEDYNCRCWAELVNPPRHSWIDWVNKKREERLVQSSTVEQLAPPRGLNDDMIDIKTLAPLDAINATISPLDFIGWGAIPAMKTVSNAIVTKIAAKQLAQEAAKRDVSWVLGSKKSAITWANQMKDRSWTDKKITQALKYGEKHRAPNEVNKENQAIRYEYKGSYLVRDEKTKEIIHLGDKHFKRPIMK